MPPPAQVDKPGRGIIALVVLAVAAMGWLEGAPALGGTRWPGSAGSTVAAMSEATGGPGPSGSQDRVGPDPDGEPPGTATGTGTSPEDSAGSDEPSANKPAGVAVHEVAPGETLWDIAHDYGTDVASIASANALYDIDYLRPGQVLQVPTIPGVVHTVQRGDTLFEIARAYGVSLESILSSNALDDPNLIQPGMRMVIPGARRQALPLVVNGRLQRAFSWPVRGPISSPFGWRWGRQHEGIDIAVTTGTPVRAAAAGKVEYARWGGGYGFLVSVDHGDGVVTRYAHNRQIVVREGQHVSRGQVLAFSGNTGNSTGPHVHFEVRFRSRAVNPISYLR